MKNFIDEHGFILIPTSHVLVEIDGKPLHREHTEELTLTNLAVTGEFKAPPAVVKQITRAVAPPRKPVAFAKPLVLATPKATERRVRKWNAKPLEEKPELLERVARRFLKGERHSWAAALWAASSIALPPPFDWNKDYNRHL